MLLQDLKYAGRTLLKTPAFALIAISCLALGIGVNATIFSVVDGVLLQPYPYPDAERIIVLNSSNLAARTGRTFVSYPDFRDWRDENTTLATLAALQRRSFTIADGRTDAERFSGGAVTWTLFGLLGTPPAIGRDFGPGDDKPGAEPVVLISDDLWRNRYNADPSIAGRAIQVNGRPHTVIGVMPPKFMFPETQRLWVPISAYIPEFTRSARALEVFARLKPGASLEQASTDVRAISGRLAATYPKENEGWSAL